MYSSEIDYGRNDLLDGNTYKLVITVNDSYGNSITQGVYITPKYGGIVKPTILSVEPYPAHNSVIIDFGKLLSISPTEAEGFDNGYTFADLEIDSTWDDYAVIKDANNSNNPYGLLSQIIHTKSCKIHDGNTLTYEGIDGTDNTIECNEPLISLTFRCDNTVKQTIFTFESDKTDKVTIRTNVLGFWRTSMVNGKVCYELLWDGYQFCSTKFLKYNLGTIVLDKIYYCPYSKDNVIATTFSTVSSYSITKNYTATNFYDTDGLQADIQEAISKKDLNYSVPYLTLSDLPTDGDYYTHTESAADFWWHVIVAKDNFYIKCLNPPDGYGWKWEV